MSADTSLILQEQEFWGKVVKKGDVRVDRILLKTDAGLMIEELSLTHLQQIIETHEDLEIFTLRNCCSLFVFVGHPTGLSFVPWQRHN